MAKGGGECLKIVSEGLLFLFFLMVLPLGWWEACELPRVGAAMLLSHDGDSVVDDVCNGPLF